MGNVTSTNTERTIIWTALIMPQISCIDPPRINIKRKLPELKMFKIAVAVSAWSLIEAAYFWSAMIGGIGPTRSGTPPLNEYLLSDYIVLLDLNTETSLTLILMLAMPDTLSLVGLSNSILILILFVECSVTTGLKVNWLA